MIGALHHASVACSLGRPQGFTKLRLSSISTTPSRRRPQAFRNRCQSRRSAHPSRAQPPVPRWRTCSEGPFGEVLRATGPLARANPLRFSTKYQDDETGLLYYGFRYYNPSSGRWLSHDPVGEEEGEPNISASACNDLVNHIDMVGLWKIDRKGKVRATAVPEPGDSMRMLADQLGLDVIDWRRWAFISADFWFRITSPDDPLPPCITVSIPNSVYIEFGEITWFDRMFGSIPRWQASLRALKHAYEVQGFYVALTDPSTPSIAAEHLASLDIYGFAYAGHGAKGAILTFRDDATRPLTLDPSPRRTQFGIHFFYAYGCYTANQSPNSPQITDKWGWRYSEWERNVATRGFFQGFWGSVDGYESSTWSRLLATPGTNRR